MEVTGKKMDFGRFFNLKTAVLLVNLVILSYSTPEVPRPRGVSLSRAALYEPDKNFTCFDGSKTIPPEQINDDYCDCLDGSDEPGTSACPGGIFYCTNAGYKPTLLPSDRVNDGICDCCDGSDEYTKRVVCENTCIEMGRAAREEAARIAELLKVGKQLRYDLIQEGQKIRQEKQNYLNELLKNKDEATKVKAEKEDIKNRAEEVENKALEYYRELEEEFKRQKAEKEAERLKEEAIEQFKKFDSNQDGLIDVSELQSRKSFDRDRNGEVTEEEAKLFLNNQDSVDFETFIEKSWPIMKPFVMIDSGMYKPPVEETEPEAREAADIQEGEHQEGQEEEGEPEGEPEEEDEDEDHEEKEPEQKPEEEHIQYDEETQKLIDQATEARNQLAEAEKDLRDIEGKIKDLEESMKKDYGPEEEFLTLDGQCFEYADHEYVYKLCPFQKTVQLPKSSSSETNLGKWSEWNGPESSPYDSMLYEHGQNCWNGPNRSTRVKVSCGTENKITSVSEPNRCEYFFEFETPAACKELSEDYSDIHDEL